MLIQWNHFTMDKLMHNDLPIGQDLFNMQFHIRLKIWKGMGQTTPDRTLLEGGN